MCGGSKSVLPPFDSEMEGISGNSNKTSSKLLEMAAMDDLAAFVHEVEERGCDVNESRFWYGRSFGSKKMGFEERTPIMIASLYGSTEVLKYIVGTCKVDVNKACGSDGATALHCAAAGGAWSSVEVFEILIAASGDINAVDAEGRKAGELIAPCVKSSSGSRRRTLEALLNGGAAAAEGGVDEEEEWGKKKEFQVPAEVSLPDINTGVYGSDEFRMYNFKVKPCSRAYSHDWTECPFVHPGENARRRDPRKYSYTCVPCPEFKKGACAKGDACEYAHGVFESWLHPAQYRTRLCKDEIGCARKVCFFAHKPEELRPLYASTGSAMPSPKSFNASSLDLTGLSPLSIGSSSSPISPSPSSPIWQGKVNLAPPALQLSGSRLKTSLTARDHVNLEMDEMAGLSSSPYSRIGDLKPTNLDEYFGSLDPSILSHLQLQSPTGVQIRQNTTNHLRASYPTNNTSAAVAAAVMNARSSAFSKRSQSFVDRAGAGAGYGYASPTSGGGLKPSKLSNWGSPDGKVDWGFNGDDASKLRKSASFGIRSASPAATIPSFEEAEWATSPHVQRRVGAREMMPQWIDQMYMEQEQMVA